MSRGLRLPAVAVVPVGGVDFATIGRLFGEKKIAAPLAILTDADTVIESPTQKWRDDVPQQNAVTGKPQLCDRAKAVLKDFEATSRSVSRLPVWAGAPEGPRL